MKLLLDVWEKVVESCLEQKKDVAMVYQRSEGRGQWKFLLLAVVRIAMGSDVIRSDPSGSGVRRGETLLLLVFFDSRTRSGSTVSDWGAG